MPGPTRPTRSVLVIDYGDLPSLVACFIQPDAGRLVLWHPIAHIASSERRLEMVQEHARLLEAPWHASEEWGSPREADGEDVDSPLDHPLLLVHAATAAVRLGVDRIVWPLQVGPRAPRVTTAVDQATLVTELVLTSRPGETKGLMIDLPLVDLDETQVLDIADDTGAPFAYWPCVTAGPDPCRVCAECSRWLDAHSRLGLPWPWAEAMVG